MARRSHLRVVGGTAPSRAGARERALVIEVKAFDEPVEGLRESLKAIRSTTPATSPAKTGAPEADVLVLSAEQVRAILAWERLTLLRTIRKTGPHSVTELAKAVNRTPSAVNDDLRFLERHGLVTLAEGRGRAKAPEVRYGHIQVRIEV